MVLIVLDGWGLAPPGPGNAISLSKLTHIPYLWQNFPHTELSASGEAVGLPAGEDGNTETGHINIGAGRVVYQDLPRINMAIADKSFFSNDAFIGAQSYSQSHQSSIHIMGLLSDSGVHASRSHLYALLELFKKNQCTRPIYLHLFTDGRDSSPKAGLRFVREVEVMLLKIGIGSIATVMGRYYAMDRDKRWERTARAYEALTEMIPSHASSAVAAVEQSYEQNVTDEFIEPTIILDASGNPSPRIGAHDAVIFYNYRIDRPRQLTRAFVLPDFETHVVEEAFDPYSVKYHHKHIIDLPTNTPASFTRKIVLEDIFFVTMTEYEHNLPTVVAFPLQPVHMTIGRVLEGVKVRQLRVAESEKERFVTYYFNGMHETPYNQEDHLIVPSPKVATYDLKPEMSVLAITERVIDRLISDVYSFVLINIANPDMVAHTGNINAAIHACEITDACVGRIAQLTLSLGGTCIITADHGNVEEMLGPNNELDTEHSTFPVPFIMAHTAFEKRAIVLPKGKLADIAPTILAHMNIPIPPEMTGVNLFADIDLSIERP